MVNYKKLTDVEVMGEVSENSMAIVNENGVLKQVPCGAGFGGGGTATAIIEFGSSRAGDKRSAVTTYASSPAISFVCNNMTYSDVLSSLQNGEFVNIVAIGRVDDFLTQGIAIKVMFVPENNSITIEFSFMPFETLYWYSDNTISTEELSVSPK